MSYEKSKIVLEILQELKIRDDNTINQQDKLNIAVEMQSQIVAGFEEKHQQELLKNEFEEELNALANKFVESAEQGELDDAYIDSTIKWQVESNTREELLELFLYEKIIKKKKYKKYMDKKW